MSEPVFDTTTEEMWERLPDHFHRMDALNDWALKKYINTVASQLQIVDDLVERIDYDSVSDGGTEFDTSDLVDPQTADASWLPWLGQLFGVYVRGKGSDSDREEIVQAASGFNAGTPAAIEAAAKDVLVDSKFAKVIKFSTPTNIGTATFWDLLLITIDAETLINLYPEIQATVAETVTWNATWAPYTPVKEIVKAFPTGHPNASKVYNNSAMRVSTTGTGAPAAMVVDSTYKVTGITPTDWYQNMLTMWTESGSYSAGLLIRFFDASNVKIGEFETTGTVTTTPTQFVAGGIAPAGTSYMRSVVWVSNVPPTNKLYIAQLGARHEINDYWIPKTADPVQAVIDKGAKPAGFILRHAAASSSWDEFVAEYPDWNAIEAAGSWESLEQTSD